VYAELLKTVHFIGGLYLNLIIPHILNY
jgi:hypothetical protein